MSKLVLFILTHSPPPWNLSPTHVSESGIKPHLRRHVSSEKCHCPIYIQSTSKDGADLVLTVTSRFILINILFFWRLEGHRPVLGTWRIKRDLTQITVKKKPQDGGTMYLPHQENRRKKLLHHLDYLPLSYQKILVDTNSPRKWLTMLSAIFRRDDGLLCIAPSFSFTNYGYLLWKE